jgi:hypothetical protein
MSLERWLLAIVIALVAALQYGLAAYTIRDLFRRPRVRGDNKVAWGLLILTLPFIGALLYGVMGPTSFLPRPNRPPRSSMSVLDKNDLHEIR